MTRVADTDVILRDQTLKDKAEGLVQQTKSNGTQMVDGVASTTGQLATSAKTAAKKGVKAKPAAAVRGKSNARGLAFLYIALAAAVVALIGSLGPVVKPEAFGENETAKKFKGWTPIPQACLFGLVLALLAAILLLRKKKQTTVLPPGVNVNSEGVLCDESGRPLPRGLKLVNGEVVIASTGTKLPTALKLGAGGVLLHAATGRPVPHSCALGPHGGLLSSDGKPLPDSMAVGPNSCLVAADGTVLSPDLQPVPPGFVMSGCGQQLLRPNKKPVPRGVHVGPGFRLLKPTGELMPDGVKIGPCGTIICLDGSILASDGHPLPAGFTLSADKTQIIDPAGKAIEEGCDLGPNCTLVSKDNKLTTILGRHALPAKAFSLGPLGNLLHKGHPVPAGAAFNSKGHLIAADTTTVLYP